MAAGVSPDSGILTNRMDYLGARFRNLAAVESTVLLRLLMLSRATESASQGLAVDHSVHSKAQDQ